jgi:hypothetical protein
MKPTLLLNNSFSPEYPIRAVSNFFRKFEEIFAAQRAPPVSLPLVANGKNLKSLKYFVWTPLGSRVNTYIIFFLQLH